jgi:hypothetical protein
VQKIEEQLRQTQQELAANTEKGDYLAGHMAQMQQAMMVRKHNTNHPFCFSDIYVLTLCNYRHSHNNRGRIL